MTLGDTFAVGIALVACVFDLRIRRIPNVLTFSAALAAFAASALTRGAPGAGASVMGWIVAMALWLPLYALGGMGAGDVKLIAAIGAWLGPTDVVHAALYAAIAGGAMALAVAIARGCARRTFRNVWLLIVHWRTVGFAPHSELTLATADSPRLAYAVPILAGTVAAIWLR
jgi:prepilin peptidase CpaA